MTNRRTDELLTLAEVAERLKIRDRRTVLRQLDRSGVAVLKVGRSMRVRSSQLERMLEELEWMPAGHAQEARSENSARPAWAVVPSPGGKQRAREAHPVNAGRARRGWTEALGDGLYRRHRLSCRASEIQKSGVRCDCPFACHQPTATPGKTSLKTIPNAQTAAEARKLKKRLQGADRPSAREGDGNIKLDPFFRDIYLKTARLDDSTKDNYLDIYEREIKPHFGHRRLVDITEEAVERWVRDLETEARERRAQTGRRATWWVATQVTVFRSTLTHAVRWRRIRVNPFEHVALGETEPLEVAEALAGNPRKVLTREQLQLLYKTARSSINAAKHDRFEALVRCGSELAMRGGETRGVRFSDFDFELGRVHLQRQVDRGDRVKWLKGKANRTLPVSRRLLELVQSLLEAERARGGSADGFVFPGKHGKPMARQLANSTLARLLIKAGLVDGSGRHLISYHGLRHTSASLLLADNVAPIKVSRFLGHASLQVTLTIYAHLLSEDELDDITATFDSFNEEAVGDEAPDQLAA
jgi:integrase